MQLSGIGRPSALITQFSVFIYIGSLIRDVYEIKLLMTGMGSVLLFESCTFKKLIKIGCSSWPRLVPCDGSRKGCHMVRVLVREAS